MRLLRWTFVIVPLAIGACESSDASPTVSPPPPPCVDYVPSGWSDCGGVHAECCDPNDDYCFATEAPHGCLPFLAIFGPKIDCDCGWSDCDNDTSNGCETDLTTTSNCGACGIHADPCATNGPTTAHPEVLFASGYQPQGLVVDDQNVYWMSDGVLTSAPKAGGTATVLAQGESAWNATMAISNGHLYWPWLTGEIHRIEVSGGPVEVLASGIGAIDSNIVAYADTAFVVVARGNAGELVDSLGHDLLATTGWASLAIQNDVLYVADGQGLRSMHVDGTSVTNVASTTGLVLTNASSVFVLSTSIDTFTNGTHSSAPVSSSVGIFEALATDTTLYVAADGFAPLDESSLFQGPSVRFFGSLDPSTGVTTALTPRAPPGGIYGGFFGPEGAAQMAADSAFVYFITYGTDCAPGNVYRFAR